MGIIKIDENYPLIGHIAFGVIDRGTNVLQVRPTTICHMNCIYCSVDAGPKSKFRANEFVVKLDWLIEWIHAVAQYKGIPVEALIDGVGDPLTYGDIVNLIQGLKESPTVNKVTLETRGYLLDEGLIREFDEVGLDRINLSIDTLNPELAMYLQGVNRDLYDVSRIKELCELIVKETNIDLHLTPVWLPGINDKDIEEIIRWCLGIGCGKKVPPLGIQKYVRHKYGRNPEGVREVSWREFYRWLKDLERKYGIKLLLKPSDYGIVKVRSLPILFRIGDVIDVEVLSEGWLRGEFIGRDLKRRRLITIVGGRPKVDDVVTVKIVRNKDNIYIGTLKP